MPANTGNLNLASIVDAAPIGVLVISKDGLITYVNDALVNMFGYSKADMVGKPVEMLLPDDIQARHILFRNQYLDQPTPRAMGLGRELKAQHARGHNFPIEIGLGVIGEGDAAQAMAFVSDISVRKKLEHRFRHVVESMPFGVLMSDVNGQIMMVNEQLNLMFGYEPGALIGQKLEILLPERNRKIHVNHRHEFQEAPSVRAMGSGRDLLALHKNGKEFPVEIALTPIREEDSYITLAAITDISMRKNLENTLRQTNANLEEFTYVASHDLRSPLRGIADLLVWIREDLEPIDLPDSIQKNFDRIQLRVERAERMIDDLLIYARAGTIDKQLSTIKPLEILEGLLLLVNAPEGINITFDVSPDVAVFESPRVPLQTCLRNLLDNAIKHMGSDTGEIRVSVRNDGRYCVFHIEDSGPGIADNAKPRIFRMFHRATTKSEGHGIGLAVTKRIVTCHGGKIELQDSRDLAGAHFALYWPSVLLKEIEE
ncbi:sensor histidine kinase [Leeia oryzae]|uniref:sensor histidine kinase n=1 Tax=Leeia oryzae TaxID=356662 RepID=UPI000374ED6B|nr:PAS domain-containing sensor histidine kinase [Leeia oryzae]